MSIITCRGRNLDYSKKTLVMGILNVTPDSFSDGGVNADKGIKCECSECKNCSHYKNVKVNNDYDELIEELNKVIENVDLERLTAIEGISQRHVSYINYR